jgi:hypothetical protein
VTSVFSVVQSGYFFSPDIRSFRFILQYPAAGNVRTGIYIQVSAALLNFRDPEEDERISGSRCMARAHRLGNPARRMLSPISSNLLRRLNSLSIISGRSS